MDRQHFHLRHCGRTIAAVYVAIFFLLVSPPVFAGDAESYADSYTDATVAPWSSPICEPGVMHCPYDQCNNHANFDGDGTEYGYEKNDEDHRGLSQRILASSGGLVNIGNYTLFVFLVLTFFLIFFVEWALESLDHWAADRLFYRAVLETVYHELATLGVVEVIIWFLHRYWKTMNIVASSLLCTTSSSSLQSLMPFFLSA
mmetsp:Transcript_28981/g.66311  ORF Transcript_28981/g.66311 Transcript_28981/m.66311 type:complete len:201 (-) Transcript_28981:4327-4929(-)